MEVKKKWWVQADGCKGHYTECPTCGMVDGLSKGDLMVADSTGLVTGFDSQAQAEAWLVEWEWVGDHWKEKEKGGDDAEA